MPIQALPNAQVLVKRLISYMMEVTVTASWTKAAPAGPEAFNRSSKRVYSSSSCVMVAFSTSHPQLLPLKSLPFSLHTFGGVSHLGSSSQCSPMS